MLLKTGYLISSLYIEFKLMTNRVIKKGTEKNNKWIRRLCNTTFVDSIYGLLIKFLDRVYFLKVKFLQHSLVYTIGLWVKMLKIQILVRSQINRILWKSFPELIFLICVYPIPWHSMYSVFSKLPFLYGLFTSIHTWFCAMFSEGVP